MTQDRSPQLPTGHPANEGTEPMLSGALERASEIVLPMDLANLLDRRVRMIRLAVDHCGMNVIFSEPHAHAAGTIFWLRHFADSDMRHEPDSERLNHPFHRIADIIRDKISKDVPGFEES